MKAAPYSAVEVLRDGRVVTVRALQPDDREELLSAVRRTSPQSLFRRFFAAKREFSEHEISFFLNIDFITHVALVAVCNQHGKPVIVGGGRYILLEAGKAELAFAVIDPYQGQGLGAKLLQHLAAIAREGGVKQFTAEVLAENFPMLRVFEKSGLPCTNNRESGVVHVALQLP